MKRSLDVKHLVAVVIPGNWGFFPYGWVEKEKKLLNDIGIKAIGTGRMPDPIFARSYVWFEYIKEGLKGAGVCNSGKRVILIGTSTGSLAVMNFVKDCSDAELPLAIVLMNTYPSPQSVKPKFPLSILRPLLVKVEEMGMYFPIDYKRLRKVPITVIASSDDDEFISKEDTDWMIHNLQPRVYIDSNMITHCSYEGGHDSIIENHLKSVNGLLISCLKTYGVTGL